MAATDAFIVQSDGGFAGADRALAITLEAVQIRLASESRRQEPGLSGVC
jgi:hypothetical protein